MKPGKKVSGMSLQNYERKGEAVRKAFVEAKRLEPERFERALNVSWSIWMFGVEPFEDSIRRLARNEVHFVELKGDHHTKDVGLKPEEIRRVTEEFGVNVSGACGMYTPENDLSSNSPYVRQRAVDYIRNEIDVVAELGGHYLIVVPSAVGRPNPIDSAELQRSSDALRRCGDDFERAGIAAAVEPIRSAEVSLVHTVEQAVEYIELVSHPGVTCLNGDIYHMWVEEDHIGEAILSCGERLVNLHLADSNRDALGRGMMDVDTAIMAAYLVGMNRKGRFVTPEPLGALRDPYLRANQPSDQESMDQLVRETVSYFRQREAVVRELTSYH